MNLPRPFDFDINEVSRLLRAFHNFVCMLKQRGVAVTNPNAANMAKHLWFERFDALKEVVVIQFVAQNNAFWQLPSAVHRRKPRVLHPVGNMVRKFGFGHKSV